jgi:hypothetical protein
MFGETVFEKLVENNQQINRRELPSNREIVQDLLRRAHAFFLQVGVDSRVTEFWTEVFGPNRVIQLPATEVAPQVQAAIIGLTEGTLDLERVPAFLKHANVGAADAKQIARSVANIPIGAQAALPNFGKRPQKGDLFKKKTDLWPVEAGDKPDKPGKAGKKKPDSGPEWL